MNTHHQGVINRFVNLAGYLIHSTAALFKGNVLFFWNQEFCIDASELDVFHYGSGNFAVLLVLAEASIGRAYAGGVFPVAVPVNLEEDGV